ncbi:MAG: type II CAAX endopeptidase family protein [Candidatus Neomarinimicrobiota bacterium]
MSRDFTYKTALWIFFITLILYMIIIQGIFVKTDILANSAQSIKYLIHILLQIFLLLPPFLYVKLHHKSTKLFFRYRKVGKLNIGYLLLISLLLFLVLLAFDYLFFMIGLKKVIVVHDMLLSKNWNVVLLIISSLIVTPIVEEAFFRGFLFRIMLKRKYSPLLTIMFSSFLFSLAHMNVSSIFQIFLAGIILAYIAYFFHSIIPGIIIHSIFNTLALVENNVPRIRESFIYGSPAIPILFLLVGGILLILGMLGLRNKLHIQHKEKGGLVYEK